MESDQIVALMSLLAILALNWSWLRSGGPSASVKVRMALIWGSIIAALVLGIKLYQS